MDQVAFQVQLGDVIGKSWSEWDLPETISESDLRRGRKLVRRKLGYIDGSDFDNVEKPNRLPSAGMFLFGSYPESDILSISTCAGCSRKYKTQWLHNRHWEKNSSGDYVCTLTKEVVIPHRRSSKHSHHHRKDASSLSSSKDAFATNNEDNSLFIKSQDVNNSDSRQHHRKDTSSSSKDTSNTTNENHSVLTKSRDMNNSGSRHHHHHNNNHRKDASSTSSKYVSISNNQNNSLFIKSRDVNNSDPSHHHHHHHRKDVPSASSKDVASTTNSQNPSLLIKSRDGTSSDSRHLAQHHRKDVSSSSSKYISLSNNHSVLVKSRDINISDSRHHRKDTSSSSSRHNMSLTNAENSSLLIKSQDVNNSESRHNHHSGHHSHPASFDLLHQQQGSAKSSSSKSINSGSSNSSSSPKNIVGVEVKQVDGTISFPPKKKKKKKSRNEPRKIVPLKDRQFDPDQHCGVPNSETGNRCTRSLTCKTHSMALRRAVPGRRIGFDQLLADHKKARDAEKAAKAAVESQLQGGAVISTTPVSIMTSAALPTLTPMISSTPIPMIISPIPLTSTTSVQLITTTTTPVPMLSRIPTTPATSHGIMNTINMNPVVTLKQLTKSKTSSPSNNTNVNFIESPSGLPTTTAKSSSVTSTITSSTANNSNNYVHWSQPVTPLISLSPHSNNNSTTVLSTSSSSSSASEFKLQGKTKSKKSRRLLELVQSASHNNDTRTVILSSVLNTSDIPLVCINARTLKAALKQKKFHRTKKVVPTIFKTQRKHETAAILMDLSIHLKKKLKKHKRMKQTSSMLTNGKKDSSSTNILLDRAQTVNLKKNNDIFSWSNSIHRNPLEVELTAQELRDAASLIQTSAQSLCKFSSVEEKDF